MIRMKQGSYQSWRAQWHWGLVAVILMLYAMDAKAQPSKAKGADIQAEVVVHDAKALESFLRSRAPSGWTVTRKEEQVFLVRTEPVEYYPGVNFHDPRPDERAEFYAARVKRDKIVVTMWLGPRILPEDYQATRKKNWLAVDQARMDSDDGKLSPDEKFWKEHPEYGFRPLPILDTGSAGVYMELHPEGILQPPTRVPRKGRTWAIFWDPTVGKDCQGFIDELGTVFSPY